MYLYKKYVGKIILVKMRTIRYFLNDWEYLI